jgi:hypothetical protein
MTTIDPATITKPSAPTPSGALPATTRRIGPRTVVASLWLFAILNYLYCDVLSADDPEFLRALLTGSVGGIEFNQPMLLASGVLMSVPMGAVLLSRIAPHRLARWSSVIAAAVMTVVQAGTLTVGSAPTLHYLYFSAIEITTTALIAWYAAARWTIDA